MVKEYRPPTLANKVAMWAARVGVGPTSTLVTTGRRSGEERRVPVTPITVEGVEYVVSPYGQVGWVHNARASEVARLEKGSRVRQVRLVDVTREAPQVAKAYWDAQAYPRKYMDVPGEATVDDFAEVAGRFPVFEIQDVG